MTPISCASIDAGAAMVKRPPWPDTKMPLEIDEAFLKEILLSLLKREPVRPGKDGRLKGLYDRASEKLWG